MYVHPSPRIQAANLSRAVFLPSTATATSVRHLPWWVKIHAHTYSLLANTLSRVPAPARKTRCSGDQPCTFCVSRGMKCVMSDDTTRGAASRSGSSRASRQKSYVAIYSLFATILAPILSVHPACRSEQPSSHSSTSPMVSALPAPTTTCPTSAK